MRGSMLSPAAEIRREKKKKIEEKKPQDKNIMFASAMQGGHKKCGVARPLTLPNHFSELAPHHDGKTAGIDMLRRNCVNVAICVCLDL